MNVTRVHCEYAQFTFIHNTPTRTDHTLTSTQDPSTTNHRSYTDGYVGNVTVRVTQLTSYYTCRRRPNHPQRRQRAHAPCLVWGHVRCVYSERAVTVP